MRDFEKVLERARPTVSVKDLDVSGWGVGLGWREGGRCLWAARADVLVAAAAAACLPATALQVFERFTDEFGEEAS
jgi:hypothetical protein